MKIKNCVLFGFIIVTSSFVYAQDAILCPSYNSYIKIENTTDIPTVSTNPDNSLNLAFAEHYITDLFSNYIIYDFYQTSPNSSSEDILKFYTISHNSKALVEAIFTQIPSTTISIAAGYNVDNIPIRSAITPNIINTLDGNTYKITQYIATSDSNQCNNNPNCELIDVPIGFDFVVTFNYDAEAELLIMESVGLSSCGNAFSIAFSGGNPNEFGTSNNTLQSWKVNSATVALTDFNQPCENIEEIIFTILDIACFSNEDSFGNITVSLDSESEIVRFYRPNGVFGEYIIELSKNNLSIAEESFNLIKPFQMKGNPYLQISNLSNQSINIAIYNSSGQTIVLTKIFKENTLDISSFSNGLYFIKLSTLNNQQKIFKFLKN